MNAGDTVPKVWGTEYVLVNEREYCAKRLVVKPGFRCSLHRHLKKNETFICESGRGWALLGSEPVELMPGSMLRIPVGTWHQFWNPELEPLILLEISQHHDDDDVERESESGALLVLPRLPFSEGRGL